MGRFVLTPEVREQAINAAIIGGNPLTILRDAGTKNTSSLWYTIKKDLQKKDPERYEKLLVRNRRANYHAASDTPELDPEQTENLSDTQRLGPADGRAAANCAILGVTKNV